MSAILNHIIPMNNSRQTIALFAVFSLALSVLTMPAQEAGSRPQPADPAAPVGSATGKTSGSGIIKEITADQFDQIDTDGDQRISLSEFTRSPILSGGNGVASGQLPTVAAPRTDGTVVVKPTSGRNTPELFRRLDRNGDAQLDSVEIAAFYLNELED